MEAIKETTVWKSDYQPNHTYLLNGSKMVAYIPFGKSEPFYFKTPMSFDRRGRKFEKLKVNPFEEQPKDDTRREVIGSKGAVYYLTQDKSLGWKGWSCTCPGYTFRGSCKHVAELQQELYGRDPY